MTTWRKAEPEAAGSRKPSCDPSGSSPTRPPPAGALRTSASRPGDTWMQALCPSHAAQTSGAVATRGCWLGGISRLGRASTRQQHCSTPFRLFTAPQAAICGRVDEDERAAEWQTGQGSRPAAPRITRSWSQEPSLPSQATIYSSCWVPLLTAFHSFCLAPMALAADGPASLTQYTARTLAARAGLGAPVGAAVADTGRCVRVTRRRGAGQWRHH